MSSDVHTARLADMSCEVFVLVWFTNRTRTSGDSASHILWSFTGAGGDSAKKMQDRIVAKIDAREKQTIQVVCAVI